MKCLWRHGIIYCTCAMAVPQMTVSLCGNGWTITFLHGGLSGDDQLRVGDQPRPDSMDFYVWVTWKACWTIWGNENNWSTASGTSALRVSDNYRLFKELRTASEPLTSPRAKNSDKVLFRPNDRSTNNAAATSRYYILYIYILHYLMDDEWSKLTKIILISRSLRASKYAT